MRRAERRGKELPEILKTALKQQIERWEKYGSPILLEVKYCKCVYPKISRSLTARADSSPCIDRGQEMVVQGFDIYNMASTGEVAKTLTSIGTDSDHVPCVVCYDARGNGDGNVVPTITGDHNHRISDYTAVVCETLGFNHLNGSKAASKAETLNGRPTLRSNSPTSAVIAYCYSQDAYDKYTESKQSATLKATGGVYGGGSETLVCAGFHPQAGKSAGISFNAEESPTLQVHKDAAVCYCLQGNGIDRADTAGCNGKGVKENESYTLNTVDRHAVCCEEKTLYVVRRLTPLECCRLQGMPDWWCKDIPHSDAQEYKMWGNGMALPNALYILEGI